MASFKLLVWGPYIEDESSLSPKNGILLSVKCRKQRYIDAIRLENDATLYWLQHSPKKLPSCEESANAWPSGSTINLKHTTKHPNMVVYAYELTVNGKQVFNYRDALASINTSKNIVLGFTSFMLAFGAIVAIQKHNKSSKRAR